MTDAQKQACDFVRYVLEQICNDKSLIRVEPIEKEHETVIQAYVTEPDMGRAVGKEGKTIAALRTLVRIIGARGEERFYLKVEQAA